MGKCFGEAHEAAVVAKMDEGNKTSGVKYPAFLICV